jgi:signal transduction histidine kinase
MPCPDDADDVPQPDALDQLRHDLKTPLTTIHARSQLLGRAIRRSPSLTDDERAWMLETLATIDEAVRTMVTVIDAMGRDRAERSPDFSG